MPTPPPTRNQGLSRETNHQDHNSHEHGQHHRHRRHHHHHQSRKEQETGPTIDTMTIETKQHPRYQKSYRAFEEEEVDIVCETIGNYGRWQLVRNVLLALFSFPAAIQISTMQMLEKMLPFWCERPVHLKQVPVDLWMAFSQPRGPCHIINEDWNRFTVDDITLNVSRISEVIKCSKFEYHDSRKISRIVAQYDLVCDGSIWRYLSPLCFCIGMALGGVISGLCSDRYGRKRVIFTALFIHSVCAAASVLSLSYTTYSILRLIQAMSGVSVMYAAFVLLLEIVGGVWATVVGVTHFLSFPLASVIVASLAHIVEYSQQFEVLIALMLVSLMALWWIIPESPKWLLVMGRKVEVEILLREAARVNKKHIGYDLTERLNAFKSSKEYQGWTTIFKNPYLKRTILLFCVWTTITIAFFGSYYGVVQLLWDNSHKTAVVASMAEIPGMICSIPLLMKVGRRIPIFLTMCVCGSSFFVAGLTHLDIYKTRAINSCMKIPCLLLGRFSIGATSIMIVTYAAELYPVKMKSLGIGTGQMGISISMIIFPFIFKMTRIEENAMADFIIGFICIAGATMTLFLPETHKPMKQLKITIDTLDEAHRRKAIRRSEGLHLINF